MNREQLEELLSKMDLRQHDWDANGNCLTSCFCKGGD